MKVIQLIQMMKFHFKNKKRKDKQMKAYIIKIELQESDPLIWRRVIMPANATYNRFMM